jgi:predicted  nucleic acid-binding Zn-ribbon protein
LNRSLEDAQEQQERIRGEIQRLQKAAEAKQAALNNHQIKLNELKDRKNSLNSDLLEVRFLP